MPHAGGRSLLWPEGPVFLARLMLVMGIWRILEDSLQCTESRRQVPVWIGGSRRQLKDVGKMPTWRAGSPLYGEGADERAAPAAGFRENVRASPGLTRREPYPT